MLILVAISIRATINGGLFQKAGQAVKDYGNKQNEEDTLGTGNAVIDGAETNIQDYVNSLIGGTEHNWTREEDTLTCSHCSASYTIGDAVDYVSNTPDNTIADIEEVESGYIDQTIAKEDRVWVVLGIEDSDGDNETLLITTRIPTTATVCFNGAEAYNNAIGVLNRVCNELYKNTGEYNAEARNMTIEDVNTCLGYTPSGGMYYDEGIERTTGNFTTKLNELSIWDTIKANGTLTPDGANNETALGEYELNGYRYHLEGTRAEKNVIFGPGTDYHYWLASRGVAAHGAYALFGPGGVGYGEAYSYDGTLYSGVNELNSVAALRPVVSLKAKLPEINAEPPEETYAEPS